MMNLILPIAAVSMYAAGAAAAEPDGTRALESELRADANPRVSLAGDGPTSGHDGRFFVRSADGNYRLDIVGEMQLRYYGVFDADDSYEGGFQTHRTRLDFRGHAIDPNLRFRILSVFDRATGELTLQDASGEYAFDNGFSIKWGQFKLPYDREQYATGPTQLLTLERSILASVFRLDRSQGVQVGYEADRWRVAAAFTDGQRTPNTAFTSDREANFAFSGRAEFRLGEAPWRQFRDQTAFRGDKSGALIGLGGHWQQGDDTSAPSGGSGRTDLLAYTADVGFEGDGWNLMAVGIGRLIDSSGVSLHDYGFLVQGGAFVTDGVELFARYAQVFPDSGRGDNSDSFEAVTAGFNWYVLPKSHAVKLTAEVNWYPSTQARSASLIRAPDAAIGILPDSSGGQVVIGTQLQFIF